MGLKFSVGSDGRYRYPKHTADQLRAIYQRNPCPEVRELLWEIHRLRLLLLRAHQLQKVYGGGCHTSFVQVLETFREEIRGEPCVEEREAWERQFFGPPRRSVYASKREEGSEGSSEEVAKT